MSNIINKDNIIINTCRNPQSQGIFRDVLISNIITDLHYCTGGNYCFPLFIISNDSNTLFNSLQQHQSQENFKSNFRNIIDLKYNHHFTPEEVLGYIYSILHSPTYREKYSEFLKTDFPRIPFTDDNKIFQELSSLGWQLIQIHLMNKESLNSLLRNNIGNYTGTGNNEVKKVEYIFNSKIKKYKIRINPEQYFEDVPEEIYNFYIGGYQVLHKYLKDRKGRTLTLDEIENVENIIKIISFTIDQMKKINELTKEWV